MYLISPRGNVANMVSYKVYIMRLLLLPLVMLFTPVVLSGDYVSKVEPIDYKCVPDRGSRDFPL